MGGVSTLLPEPWRVLRKGRCTGNVAHELSKYIYITCLPTHRYRLFFYYRLKSLPAPGKIVPQLLLHAVHFPSPDFVGDGAFPISVSHNGQHQLHVARTRKSSQQPYPLGKPASSNFIALACFTEVIFPTLKDAS